MFSQFRDPWSRMMSSPSPPPSPRSSPPLSPLDVAQPPDAPGPGPAATPTEALTESSMDVLLANELRQLALEEREAMCEEIHGVNTLAVPETPELLAERLAEMEEALCGCGTTTTGGGDAYGEALMLGSQYVHDPALRLMFLRAERFNATKAALRLVNFLQLIRDYLGPEYLVRRPWLLSSFTPDELKVLKRGSFQLFPGRDRSGRRISGVVGNDVGDRITQFKMSLCMYMTTAEDVETQQKGMVMVYYQSNPSTRLLFDKEERVMVHKMVCYAPIRVSATHVCFPDNPAFGFVKAIVMATANHENRTRMRFHTGSPIEILYSLQTFGISPDQVPINSTTGEAKIQNHLKWVSKRQAIEAAHASGGPNFVFRGIVCPNHHDVLLGRGRPIVFHRGNIAMRQAVESSLPSFAAASDREARAAIIWEVVQETYRSGGRFLKEDPGKRGWWIEVDPEVARQKVAVYFRDLKGTTASHAASAAAISATATTNNAAASDRSSVAAITAAAVARRRQDLDSSTYDFVQASSSLRGRKRHKPCGGGGGSAPYNGCFFGT